jgi:hypothetical protein
MVQNLHDIGLECMLSLRLIVILFVGYLAYSTYETIKLRLAVENISSAISEMNERMID